MKGLGRLPAPDPRDHAYAIRTLLASAPIIPLPTHRYYATRTWLDQNGYPHCVGYAWAHWLELGPVAYPGRLTNENADQIYRVAQVVDEWPGIDYAGTSVRAGAKVLQADGRIESYLWAFDAATVMD